MNDMKKRIDKAIALLREAKEALTEAKAIFNLCGIDICGGFEEDSIPEWNTNGANLQLYFGMDKLEKITGVSGYFVNDVISGKERQDSKFLKYGGFKFVQLSDNRRKFVYRKPE